MDLAKKFLMIEQELVAPKQDTVNYQSTEIEEIVNWRMMFSYTSKWLEKTMSNMFDHHYKNKRKKIYIVNLEQESIEKILKDKLVLQRVLESSSSLVNSISSKFFIFVHQTPQTVTMDMYHLVPLDKKENVVDRLEKAVLKVKDKLLENNISGVSLESVVQIGDGKDYYLRGVRVSLIQYKTQAKKKSRDYGQFANL